MQIPVLIEPVDNNGFRARGGDPFAMTADGKTREEALANLREKLQESLGHEKTVVPLELPEQLQPLSHPLAEFVGMFKDDPLIKDWKKSMKSHRQKRDKDADKP